MSFESFRDEGFGKALPHYYSHRSVTEYLSESELGRVVEVKLLRRIADSTKYSKQLLDELRKGGTAGNLPAWAESQNNLGAAHLHFAERMRLEGATIEEITSGDERIEHVLDWLDEAEAASLLVQDRLKKAGFEGIEKVAPTGAWSKLVRDEAG